MDGRYGRSGAVSGADAPSGRRRLLSDESGKPRPHQVQAGAPCGRHRQDSVHHLYRADGGGGSGPAHCGHVLVRRGEPLLHHHGHRRLLRPQHLYRRVSVRRYHMGHRGLYVSGRHQLFAAVRRCAGPDQGRSAQRGAAVVSADFSGYHRPDLRRPARGAGTGLVRIRHRRGVSGYHHHEHHRLRHQGLHPVAHLQPVYSGAADVCGRLRRFHSRRHEDQPPDAAGQEPAA